MTARAIWNAVSKSSWIQSKSMRIVLVGSCLFMLAGDWILFSNCTPLYNNGPMVCDAIPWPSTVFPFPKRMPSVKGNGSDYQRFLGLSSQGDLFGFSYSPYGSEYPAQGFAFSMSGDSMYWVHHEKPFFPVGAGKENEWLGCEGQINEATGPFFLIGQLMQPPSLCQPGKWVRKPTESFVAFEALANHSCIAQGLFQDSLAWGTCVKVGKFSSDSLVSVIWENERISTPLTNRFKGQQIVGLQGDWLLLRKLNSAGNQNVFNYSLENWKASPSISKPLPTWNSIWKIWLRQDGQIAAYVWDNMGASTQWHILDSNLVDITPSNWGVQESNSPMFLQGNVSTGNGMQWIFPTTKGLLEIIKADGTVESQSLPTQPFTLSDIFMAQEFSIGILNATDENCNQRLGLYPFTNPFP